MERPPSGGHPFELKASLKRAAKKLGQNGSKVFSGKEELKWLW
jgi:hypothetical protein